MKKGKIQEMLDSDNNLIGNDDMPQNNPNQIKADGTTDHNAAIGHQHYTNDFLGRFGFYFYENDGDQSNSILVEIAKLKYEAFQECIKALGKDPKKYATYRKMVEKPFEELSEEESRPDYDFASKVMGVIKNNSKEYDGSDEERTLDESEMKKIIEDIIAKKKDSMSFKKSDNDILSDKTKQIKSLFGNLSDREKGELIKQLK